MAALLQMFIKYRAPMIFLNFLVDAKLYPNPKIVSIALNDSLPQRDKNCIHRPYFYYYERGIYAAYKLYSF